MVSFGYAKHIEISSFDKKIQKMEKQYKRIIGFYALDTSNNNLLAYRDKEFFHFQSTFKFLAISALLFQHDKKNILQKKVLVDFKKALPWSPITRLYQNKKVSLETLAMGAITYSDNMAVNILIEQLGGLSAINNFARKLSNQSFNLKHYEVSLSSNPNNQDDSATPKDMALSIKKILVGNTLSIASQKKLINWMKDNTTAYQRIRAGVPIGWTVADKTGTGSYGIANDIGIIWSPYCNPIILAIFTKSKFPEAKPQDKLIAQITQLIMVELRKNNECFAKMEV